MRVTPRQLKLIIATAIGILAGVVVLSLRLTLIPEPSYHGKPLHVLLQSYNGPGRDPEAKDALRSLGSNAVPTLLSMLRAKDSPITQQCLAWAHNLHIMRKTAPPPSAWSRNWSAAFAFYDLGPDGRAAIPALIKIYDRGISESSQGAAAYALGSQGPAASNAVSHLVRGMATATGPARANTIYALSYIAPAPVQAAFTSLSHDPDAKVRAAAAYALGKCHTKPAVAALQSLQNDQNQQVRDTAKRALDEQNEVSQ